MKSKDFTGLYDTQTIDTNTGKGTNILRAKGRAWMLIVNNPDKYSITPNYVKETLADACDKGIISYWCCIYEKSLQVNKDTGNRTIHMHIVVYFPNTQRGSWLHKRFPHASLYLCSASVPSIIQYIKKDKHGAWFEKTPSKADEKLPDEEAKFTEWGEMPGRIRNTTLEGSEEIVDAIKNGLTDAELLNVAPQVWSKLPSVRQTRIAIKSEEYLNKYRQMDVTYIEGPTSAGKTKFVMTATNYKAFIVDDYAHPWDGYDLQDTVVFEEFRSQFSISEMLRWLDGNPVKLKARYVNPVACFTKVYICSNWKFDEQYKVEQKEKPRDWEAFKRRINHKMVFEEDGTYNIFDNVNSKWVKRENP